jgi:hypothetical protein
MKQFATDSRKSYTQMVAQYQQQQQSDEWAEDDYDEDLNDNGGEHQLLDTIEFDYDEDWVLPTGPEPLAAGK